MSQKSLSGRRKPAQARYTNETKICTKDWTYVFYSLLFFFFA